MGLQASAGPRESEGPSIWTVDVLQRVQEGEFLYFAPATRVDVIRWEVSRGAFRRRPEEYVPGSDPNAIGPEVLTPMVEGRL